MLAYSPVKAQDCAGKVGVHTFMTLVLILLIINDVMNERYLSGKVSLIVFMAKTTYFRLSLIPISRIIVSTSDMGRYIC